LETEKGPSQGPEPGRPQMPAGYGVDPRSREGLLTWSRVSSQMAQARNYWIGTTRPDGRPHAVPVWGVWLDEVFYFSTDRLSRKARNLDANPAIVVHLESGDDVVILEGTAHVVADRSVLERFVEAYDAKYRFRPQPSEAAPVYGVRPRVAYAWLERDFPRTATRWVFQ